ncbi:MAG: hypothetical protein Aureis2KO_25480 [Aureisphaera sp.]
MTFEECLKQYDAIIDTLPEIDRLGKTMPYTSSNTYMYSLVNKAGEMGIRMSKEDQAAFSEKYPGTEVYKSYGAVMKDYVHIPEELLSDTQLVGSYLRKGLAYVNSLKPNPRKKK